MTEPDRKPPMAERKPHVLTLHGHSRLDDYFWLRERENPEVLAYLEAENRYTQSMMDHTAELQAALYQELIARIQESDQEAPVRRGRFEYYSRTEAGRQYAIYCRRKISEGQGSIEGAASDEEILLDLNEAAQGFDYCKLGVFRISPDQRWLAYSLDLDGGERFQLAFKNLETGQLQSEKIAGTIYTGEWANDNRTYFYTTQNEVWRTWRLYRHILGHAADVDSLIYQEDDVLFELSIEKTRDQAYLLLVIESLETAEIGILEADNPLGVFRIIEPRRTGHKYFLEHRPGVFYIGTNDGAKNYRVVTASDTAPGRENWLELIPHDEAVKIDGLDAFQDHLVIHQRRDGLKSLRILDLTNRESRRVAFPEAAYDYGRGDNPEFTSRRLRITYSSLKTPDTAFDYDFDLHRLVEIKRKPVLGGFDPDQYVVERRFAPAEDGTKVPISLVYRREFKADGQAPCLLNGYGAYGYSIEPAFNMDVISLLDRGFVYARAHIRGGQEMGRFWYDSGKLLNKRNSFTDFIACGKYLIDEKYTRPEKLAIIGRSAGGLLIGAVLNLAPDLCQAAVAHVAFVDAVTTMLDESIPLTSGEFEEWGNPQEAAYYQYILSYSPYDNVQNKPYPHILATAGLNDPRVQYWEPAKWVAKMRRMKVGDRRLLLKTNMQSGHAGASGRYDHLKETAFEYAFLLDSLDLLQ